MIRILSSMLALAILMLSSPAAWAGEMLPLSEIVLYASGVGYFQRDGVVDGRSQVELKIKALQVNDLLKSLIVQDFDGGQVASVTYDSRDPVTRTLKSFAVDLTDNMTLGRLLERLRGEQVEITAPQAFSGAIVGVEKQTEKVGELAVREIEVLTLLTADGFRSLPLPQIQRIRPLNARLAAELEQALGVLASGRDTQKKTVRFDFSGAGRRRVRVGYIAEAPVWKTSYRLALSDAGKPFLQGWAIVENTTDDDWRDVKLSLVSGRPVSFVMDLYEPLYAERPVVVSESYRSLRPRVYEQAVVEERESAREAKAEAMLREEAAPARKAGRPAPAPAIAAAAPPPSAEMQFQRGVGAAAQAAETGELFRYAIDAPVSLPRQKSAMLPIVSQEVQGTKLSIYNERANAKHPMNGFRLKNTTALDLMQGPITIFDGGIYAGDAQIADLPAGQERLLSYALDLKTEVEAQGVPGQEMVAAASLKKGVLVVTRKATQERAYAVANREAKRKVVLVEHPYRSDWRLVEPATASERARDVYRFEVPVAASGKAQLRVREERQIQQTVRLVDTGPDTIAFYIQAKEVSPKVKEALQKVIGMRDRISQTSGQRGQLEKRVEEIGKEQGRIRENMGRVAQNSDLYARYLKRLDEQETEIERLRKEIDTLRATEERQKRELNDFLVALDVD